MLFLTLLFVVNQLTLELYWYPSMPDIMEQYKNQKNPVVGQKKSIAGQEFSISEANSQFSLHAIQRKVDAVVGSLN